jgi:LysM domain
MKLLAAWIASLAITAVAAFQLGAASVPETRTVLTIPGTNINYGGGHALYVPLPASMTPKQIGLLNVAYTIAHNDGVDPPQLLQGIIMQESHAGDLASYKVAGPPGHRYYGVGQIKLSAAKDVLHQYPIMWNAYGFQTRTDDEVMARLIEDDTFNIAIASKYLVILRHSGYHSPNALAVAYNRGPGGAHGVLVATNPYALGVAAHMRAVAPRGGTYHVEIGDSLSKIAAAQGVNMQLIFDANPHAFVDGNQDVLMAGMDLTIPRR